MTLSLALMHSRPALRLASLGLCLVAGLQSGHAQTVLRAADQKGLQRALLEAAHALDGTAYRIEWSEFPAAAPLLQALSANAVDTGIAGDGPFLFAYEAGNDVRATVALQLRAAGRAIGIVVPAASPIKSAADLVGHRIATGRGSIGHAMLLGLERTSALRPDQLDIVFLSPSQSAAALQTGSVDAWATWEPYIALEEQSGGRVVVDGKGLTANYGFQVSNSHAIATKHAELADFYARLAKAYVWGAAHPHEFAALWSQKMGLPLAVGEKVATGGLYHQVPIDSGVITAEQTTIDDFRRANAVPGAGPDLKGAFDLSFQAK